MKFGNGLFLRRMTFFEVTMFNHIDFSKKKNV